MNKVFLYVSNRYQIKISEDDKISFPFLVRREDRNVQILVYHRINDEKAPFFTGVPTKVFEKQMELLASQYRVLKLDEAVERMKKNDIPDNAVVVTFDDGYKDNFVNAFPILKKYSIPATTFLATGAIDSGKPLWHDLVFSVFRETTVSLLDGFGDCNKQYSLSSREEQFEVLNMVLTFLRAQNDEDRQSWIEKLRDKLGVAKQAISENLMLSWMEAKEMESGGVSFGSHTVTHPVLTRVRIGQVLSEIYESKKAIEEHLGIPVTSFAYPNGKKGDFNDDIKNVLRDAGFTCAVTTIFGTNRKSEDLFELRRGTPWEQDLPSFAVKFAWYKYCFLG